MRICLERFSENFFTKSCRFKNNAYLCTPVEKTDTDKFIEKTDLLYKKQVPRKYNLSRSVNSFVRIISVRTS